MRSRVSSLFQNTIFRYLFAIAMVGSMFALRIWLIPFTGTGAPFVLLFAAVLTTSLFAGVGPAICAVLLSMPLGAYPFGVGAGYSVVQASFQALLFAVDGIIVIYLTFLTKKRALSLVIESKRPIVVEQITLQYIETLGHAPAGHLQAFQATGVTSFVAVPLLMRGQPLGALFLGSSTLSRVFGQGALRLAEALADRAAIAIENARLYRSAIYAAQLRDQVLDIEG
jgi:GAF domain-containing protein